MAPDFTKNLGLDPTEAKVYVALLSSGASSVTDITKKAGITRTLGYHVIEKLVEHGLVHKVEQGTKKKLFAANHPAKLLEYLEGKESEWREKKFYVEQNLHKLGELYTIVENTAFEQTKDSEKSLQLLSREIRKNKRSFVLVYMTKLLSAQYISLFQHLYQEAKTNGSKLSLLVVDNRETKGSIPESLTYIADEYKIVDQDSEISDIASDKGCVLISKGFIFEFLFNGESILSIVKSTIADRLIYTACSFIFRS